MRHHTAAELVEGGFHFASVGKRGGYPLGDCANHDPHPTADDARRCYQAWRRSQVERQGQASWTSCFVPGCDNPARQTWGVKGGGYSLAVLCADHDDLEHAIPALHLDGELAGDAWTSG